MEIQRFTLGPLSTNTYILSIADDAIVIDPASKAEKIIDLLAGKKLLAVLLTHGHFDHIKATDGLYQKYHCPIYLHEDDEEMARDKNNGLNYDFPVNSYITSSITHLIEGNCSIGPFNFETIFTPGHSKGSVIFKFEEDLFTGDTLFMLSVGRVDLPGGNERELKSSLRIIKSLDKNYRVHPGHEAETTLDFERENNPYLRNI